MKGQSRQYLFDRAAIVGHRCCREEILATAPIMIPPPDGIWTPVEWGGIRPEPPFLTFEDRLDLYAGDLKIELHYVGGPAHTRSDVLAWIPERGVLFTGDLVFKGATPFVLMGSVAVDARGVEGGGLVRGHHPGARPR